MARVGWFGVLALVLAATGGYGRIAQAEPTKPPAAKAAAKLNANGELLVRMIAVRTPPSGLDAKGKASLRAIATKLSQGDQAGALSLWKSLLKAHGKQLTRADATRAALWMIREGLLEPDTELAAAADKVRYHREAQAKAQEGIAALTSATQQAKSKGKPVKVTVVSIVAYAKYQAATKVVAQELSAAQAEAKKKQLEAEKDSLSELSDQDMLWLQRLMDQKNQLETMISNVMKAGSDVQNSLAGNLKA